MKDATNAMTFVPLGTITDIVFILSSITPVAAGLENENAVIAFAVLGETVTVTVYVAVELSAAVTVYVTGFVKLFGVVPLTCTVEPTCTLAPVVANEATRAVTFVPYGTVTDIVFALSLIIPVAAGLENERKVIAFAVLGETVTVTVYVAVELSAAVTVYVTGFVKLFGVVPLTCMVEPTCTLAPVVANEATRAVTFVPYGTVTDTVFALSLITPVAIGLENEKAVIAFADDRGTGSLVPPPPPPHDEIATKHNKKEQTMQVLVNLFIMRSHEDFLPEPIIIDIVYQNC